MYLLSIAFKWCPAIKEKNYKHLSNIKSDTKGEKKITKLYIYIKDSIKEKNRIAALFVLMDCAT